MILSFKDQFVYSVLDGTKIHTARADKTNRWKPGMGIQFWKGNPRNVKQNPYQFGEGKVAKIERLVIVPPGEVFGDVDSMIMGECVKIGDGEDKRILKYNSQIEQFAKDDGFKSLDDFWEWFNTPFVGRLIQWEQPVRRLKK